MNCENKRDFYNEEIMDMYIYDGVEEFLYACGKYYDWMSKEDIKLFSEWLKDDVIDVKTSDE